MYYEICGCKKTNKKDKAKVCPKCKAAAKKLNKHITKKVYANMSNYNPMFLGGDDGDIDPYDL